MKKTMNSTSSILKSILFTLFMAVAISCSEESPSPLVEKPLPEKGETNKEENKETNGGTNKSKKVTDISLMSHDEDGWKKTKRYEDISFEHAINLKID